jgi:hypothetical protein
MTAVIIVTVLKVALGALAGVVIFWAGHSAGAAPIKGLLGALDQAEAVRARISKALEEACAELVAAQDRCMEDIKTTFQSTLSEGLDLGARKALAEMNDTELRKMSVRQRVPQEMRELAADVLAIRQKARAATVVTPLAVAEAFGVPVEAVTSHEMAEFLAAAELEGEF